MPNTLRALPAKCNASVIEKQFWL